MCIQFGRLDKKKKGRIAGDVSTVEGVQISPSASGYKLGLCYKRRTIAPLQKKEKEGIAREKSPFQAEVLVSTLFSFFLHDSSLLT
jgi:hypothetical protein